MGGAVAQLFGLVTLRMANANVIPYDVPRYAQDLKGHFDQAVKNVKEIAPEFEDFQLVREALVRLERSSADYQQKLNEAMEQGSLDEEKQIQINQGLIGLEKSWIDPQGMYYGDWYKSLYVCNDPFSGYASWILPGIQYEVAINRTEKLDEWDERYAAAILDLASKIENLAEML
jgi:N-acetylated-alpha-linked acidic dipeptidase